MLWLLGKYVFRFWLELEGSPGAILGGLIGDPMSTARLTCELLL